MFNWLKKSKKSKWIDVGMYDDCGTYTLVQMRYCLETNKKEFRTESIGFINDYMNKPKLFENILKYNLDDDINKNLWDELDEELNKEVELYNKCLKIKEKYNKC